MSVSIRAAKPDDLALIVGFIRDLAAYERLAHAVRLDPERLGEHLFGARPMAEVLIAEVDAAPVGFALFFHNFSTFEGAPGVYLEDLFVRPEVRGVGAGKALLAELARLAVERHCARLEWSVLDWNTPAIDFYRSIGAQTMNGWLINRLDGDALKKLARA